MRPLLACFVLAVSTLAAADPKAVLTDSTPALLNPTKRVAITSVVVSFQVSTGSKALEKGSIMNLFAPDLRGKQDALTVLQMPDLDRDLAGAIAEEVYKQLQAELTAQGFEVVPEATVLASPAYQKIVQTAGVPRFSKFANRAGDTLLASPAKLQPYLAYTQETGGFQAVATNYIDGWVTAFGGKSSTPGGPSIIKLGEIWGLPALEVALAKELNAHLVKATYLVTLGTTKTKIGHTYGSDYAFDYASQSVGKAYTKTVESGGSAHAQVGIFPFQTRIAFRAPNGNAKWQKVSMIKDAAPAKDGDVVVTLAEPLVGGTEFFSLNGSTKEKKLFGLGAKADNEFIYTAQITDEAEYAREVASMLRSAQHSMLSLVKR